MESLLNSGIQFILWLQSLGSWLTPVMKLFTFLGNTEFYLIIAPAVLWCIDSNLGLRLGIFLMINGAINGVLKIAFHNPRPYWFSKEISVMGSAENSFGIPSGHAQNAVVVWGAIAERLKTRWAWAITIFIMLMIGFSRLYLGLHFPQDVLVGWLFGAVILWMLLYFERPVVNWIKKYPGRTQIGITFLISLGMIVVPLLALLSLSGWSIPTDWTNNTLSAFPGKPNIAPLSPHNVLTTPGAFFGMAAGWIWLSMRGGFFVQGEWWKLILRYIAGLAGVLILYMGLDSLFPETETLIAYTLRYIRYALIGFWITGIAPWLFIKLRLATGLKSPAN